MRRHLALGLGCPILLDPIYGLSKKKGGGASTPATIAAAALAARVAAPRAVNATAGTDGGDAGTAAAAAAAAVEALRGGRKGEAAGAMLFLHARKLSLPHPTDPGLADTRPGMFFKGARRRDLTIAAFSLDSPLPTAR